MFPGIDSDFDFGESNKVGVLEERRIRVEVGVGVAASVPGVVSRVAEDAPVICLQNQRHEHIVC